MWEEEDEQIWECGRSDSVWERLRNQPLYSPPPSPSSGKVFPISPQFYFSLPPPPSILISPKPQLHFSAAAAAAAPPPPPPPPNEVRIWIMNVKRVSEEVSKVVEYHYLRARKYRNISEEVSKVVEYYYLREREVARQYRNINSMQRTMNSQFNTIMSKVKILLSSIANMRDVDEKKNTRDKLKRNYKSISVITREDLEQNFGSSREDVANSFGVSVSTMKHICRKHGISRWPFQPERKKERLMEVISPSMHEKHDSRLRCIQTPLHARSSPRTIALLGGGEMVQLDSSKQQSLVEFDVTNNSAHLVRASQSSSTVSHSDETNSRETLKRKCTTESVLSFEDLQQHFGCKRDDAAKALGVSVSTLKRSCRQHGIPWWPSRKKKKVSKTDCILLEPQGEKDVSPTCSKMPTEGQTDRDNEMVGHLQDQNEGPNLLNTENGSNKESITTLIFQNSVPVSEMDCILFEPEGEKNVSPTCKTPTVGIVLDFTGGPNLSNTENHSNEESITTLTFQDSVPVFERDCILLEPQGEKNVSPTHKTPTNGQTEVGNGMVGHIQDQNGIVPEFIEGPNLSNTENCSTEKSLTTPNFQDSVPGNYPAVDFSISSTYSESGEAGGSKDSKNFSASAVGFLMGEYVSESSWTMDLRSDLAPMQTMTTISHIMPHLTEKQDIGTVTFKAQYRDKKIKFRLSLPSGIVELKKQVTNRLGELCSFEVHYEDNDNEWILIGCDTDVWDCFELSSSSGNEVVRLLVRD